VKGVAATAYAYALKYGADVCKAVAAALYHDWFRDAGTDRLDALIEAYGLDARLKGNPDLSHSKIAAAYMENELGIDDSELLDAVRFHTTGRPAMSLLEKVIYIADATEPSRVFPAVSRLRELAWEDLDKACVFALENTIRYVEERGGRLDTDTLEALGWLNAAAGATCKKERGFDVAEQ
jgi:predicted HD superfamily hydrolase involved in NAD metabolism